MQLVTIDKVQAAGYQIDQSIKIYFEDNDFVSPITLIYSAWHILKDILKIRNIESSRNWLKDEYYNLEPKKIWKELDSIWNFLKHGEDDFDKVINFPIDYVEGVITLAIKDFSELHSLSLTMELFQLWFIAKNKEIFLSHTDVYSSSQIIFPNLDSFSYKKQKRIGCEHLIKSLSSESYAQDMTPKA